MRDPAPFLAHLLFRRYRAYIGNPGRRRRRSPTTLRLETCLHRSGRGERSTMDTTRGTDPDRPDRDRDITDDEGQPMPPEPLPSPGEVDRERLGQDDVSEQAP